MVNELNGNENGLVVYLPMNEGDGINIFDKTSNGIDGYYLTSGSSKWENGAYSCFNSNNGSQAFTLDVCVGLKKMKSWV